MISVELGHEEANIRCAMVLLLAQYASGAIPLPLSVRMAPHHLLEEAWRAAAIAHLNGKTVAKAAEKRRHEDAELFQELNSEFDWEEKREKAR